MDDLTQPVAHDRRDRVQFFLVDVFADRPLTGNPLALVVDAQHLDEAEMRAIAREFNQSETTFLLPPTRPEATWRLRSFTAAGHEVLGAGHNALGAWLWLEESGRLPDDLASVVLAQEIGHDVLRVGVIRQNGTATSISMDQSAPVYGATADDRAELARSLRIDAVDLEPNTPAQVVSTGADHLLVHLRSRAAVDRAVPDPTPLAAVLRSVGGEGCYVYSTDTPAGTDDAVAYARFFNPTVGIAEDPATGTAAGPLVAALVERGQAPADKTVIVQQGVATGRPSRIQVKVSGARVTVSGSGLVVAEGTLIVH